MEDPRLSDPVKLALLAAALFILALRDVRIFGHPIPDWLKFLFLVSGAVFAFFAIIDSISYMMKLFALRVEDIREAWFRPSAELARELRGLNPEAVSIVGRHDILKIVGMVSESGPLWAIKCPDGKDIPWEFIDEFLRKSQETEPYLWPIREADQIPGNWPSAARMATSVTDLILHPPTGGDWAMPAAGRYAAKLVIPLPVLAAKFGVEL